MSRTESINHITFNQWKHYLPYYKQCVSGLSGIELQAGIKKIGTNQMDMYEGMLSIGQIEDEIMTILHSKALSTIQAYRAWIRQGGGFRTVELSDSSVWILREGESDAAYIHIHPGRYSPATFRVKASPLKAAIYIRHLGLSPDSIDTELINHIRVRWLGLSPVKYYEPDSATALFLQKLYR